MSKVLVIGSGGREHCLAWKLSQSDKVAQVFASPGNAGTSKLDKCKNQPLSIHNHTEVTEWCLKENISLVVVGPECPLANGITDHLSENGIACFGPTARAAIIEASKAFAKLFMEKYSIPTAKYKEFTDSKSACDHINSAPYPALVVKASGLAGGKGVIVARTKAEACKAVNTILNENKFGEAGKTIIIEELLWGEEFSFLCFTDGTNIEMMPPAQDHKRLLDGDQGPNTGGMGSYCPCPQISKSTVEFVKHKILQAVVDGMRNDGRKYVGVLYAGIIITKNGPRVLEFNCRFGDPECQVILPLLDCDLFPILMACISGSLNQHCLKWKQNTSALTIVMASCGYPDHYETGKQISGIRSVNERANLQVFEAGTKFDESDVIVTSGGRVLAVTAIADSLSICLGLALAGVNQISFQGACHRNDIGYHAIDSFNRKPSLTYALSGVDIGKGDAFVSSIKSMVKNSARTGCLADLGGFGGLFNPKAAGYRDPVLVSGCDGVGTKLLIAQACGSHKTIGIDLVAMCVNDILTHNAEPLFFLDYFACGKLQQHVAKDVVEGITKACRESGCALIGGETAEMPGMYDTQHYDVAGFAVGAYERGRDSALPRVDEIEPGDCIIGISSTGLHSNGFSLVRKVVEISGLKLTDPAPFETSMTLGESILTPTAIYCKPLLPILRHCPGIKSAAHITGGGIIGNLPRVLPCHVTAQLNAESWNIPKVFKWICSAGNITTDEMLATFNCGIGFCIVVSHNCAETVLSKCQKNLVHLGLSAMKIGEIAQRDTESCRVHVRNIENALRPQECLRNGCKEEQLQNGFGLQQRKVAVLVSGTGTNLQALMDYASSVPNCTYKISLVLSNKKGVLGVQRAKLAGIPTQIINHKEFSSREKFDEAMDNLLTAADIEFICLAGFMRLLSGWFVQKWRGQIINVHPSILPAFKGINAHQQVLDAGVCVSGCTVHFVSEKMDEGAILAQETVPVYPEDTVEKLQERVKIAEHKIFPRALEVLTSGQAQLDKTKNKVLWRKHKPVNGL
uniref:Trifunctional purine biosynthetic protein adenosine-3 n=1 Tax=Phallusia mammillata TaxID=59560 RepID=A0A6F9DE13_9ASCI|nr:trifunctional purine biosynthetic protein adenosine-3-like [Phallusia mammillata]